MDDSPHSERTARLALCAVSYYSYHAQKLSSLSCHINRPTLCPEHCTVCFIASMRSHVCASQFILCLKIVRALSYSRVQAPLFSDYANVHPPNRNCKHACISHPCRHTYSNVWALNCGASMWASVFLLVFLDRHDSLVSMSILEALQHARTRAPADVMHGKKPFYTLNAS